MWKSNPSWKREKKNCLGFAPLLGFKRGLSLLSFSSSPLFLSFVVGVWHCYICFCVWRCAKLRWWCLRLCVLLVLLLHPRDIIKRKREKTTPETQNGALGQRPILDGDDETLPTQSTQRLGLDDHEILALLKQTEEERTSFIQGRGEGKKVLLGEMFGREEENQHPSVLA